MGRLISPQLKRLLGYVKPYSFRMIIGVFLVAFVAAAEGVVALMIVPAVEYVLDPTKVTRELPLTKLPWNGHTIYLNWFFPRFHNVGNDFLVFRSSCCMPRRPLLSIIGVTQIQYAGHAAIRDLRNALYEKIIRQPISFFQKNQTGRVISTAINDVDKTRLALSEYLADLVPEKFYVHFVSRRHADARLEISGIHHRFAAFGRVSH